MRALQFISTDTLNDPPDLHAPALIDKQSVWNALISILKHYNFLNPKTQYLTGSRTLETINLRATASAKEAVRELKSRRKHTMPLAISTNIAAEKANYYLGYNADKVQESIKRLASGRRLTSPVQDPGNLAVSMKLSASLNRLAGAMNNAQNGISFLEVQDGMLETTGKIIDRMSELKGLASQDPMKSEMDRYSYNNEFKDLQIQLYSITNEQFNGVSLFSNFTSEGNQEVMFNGMYQDTERDNTISIHTSQNGSGGAKVSLHKVDAEICS